MATQNVGRRVTWGKPPKTGEIMAYVPAGASIAAMASSKRLTGVPRFEEDRSQNDRYLVRGDQAGRRKAKWWAPKAKDIDAALGNAPAPAEGG